MQDVVIQEVLTSFLSHTSMSYWWKNSILLIRMLSLSTFITCEISKTPVKWRKFIETFMCLCRVIRCAEPCSDVFCRKVGGLLWSPWWSCHQSFPAAASQHNWVKRLLHLHKTTHTRKGSKSEATQSNTCTYPCTAYMYFFCRIREAAHFPDTFTQIPRQNCYIYLFVERTWWKMPVKCPIEATQPHTHIGPHSPPPSSRTVWVTPGTAVPIRFILFSCLRVWIMDQTRGQVISRYQQWYLQTENYFSCLKIHSRLLS